MSNNSLKTPFAATLPTFARGQIDQASELDGMALPCHVVSVSGAIVTVAFDIQTDFTLPQAEMAILGAEYVRLPVQIGCKGLAIPADAYLGAVTGLGGSTTPFLQPGNLGALAFLPIGNKNFSTVDGNVLVMYGPNGVTLRDANSNTTIVLTTTAATVTRGSVSLVVDNTGVTVHGNLTVTGSTSFGGGGKKVVLDGDPVTTGGTVTATSTTIKAT